MIRPEEQSEKPAGDGTGTLTPQEFARRFESAFRLLWLVAVGIVADRNLAEDAVQEAAIVALGKLDQFEAGTNFVAWMAQTVRFVALNIGRKHARRRHLSLDVGSAPIAAAAAAGQPLSSAQTTDDSAQRSGGLRLTHDMELPADQRVLDDQIIRAINALGPTPRACLLMRTVEGLQYSEIALALSIPQGTAMSHVHRARQQLRRRLTDPDGRTQPPGASMDNGREGGAE